MVWQFILTGAAGHLAHAIELMLVRKGYAVRGLVLPGERVTVAGVTSMVGDVTKPETLEPLFAGIDPAETVLIHAAGIVSIERRATPALRQVNVEGTRNVAQACRTHGVRMVYVSSVHAIAAAEDSQVICETEDFDPARVVGAYAKTKAEATALVLQMAREGLDAVVVHPSGIIGPYDRGSNHLTQLILMRLNRTLPAGVKGGYDFVDVRDVAAGTVAAALEGERGACYILSGQYATIGELLTMVRTKSGGPHLWCVPMAVARAAAPMIGFWARLRGRRPLFTSYALCTLHSNARFSHARATRELGYAPRPLEETVGDTVEWLMQEANAGARTLRKRREPIKL